jgi:hypothetical protein
MIYTFLKKYIKKMLLIRKDMILVDLLERFKVISLIERTRTKCQDNRK